MLITRLLATAALAAAIPTALAAQALDIRPPRPAVAAKPAKPTPLPPARPATLGGAAASVPASSAPVQTAAAEPAAAAQAQIARVAKPEGPLSQQEAVQRLNAYFNSFATLQADFIQFANDGKRYEGRVYIQRPGKMRFEYRPPVTMEVIADGTSVAIRDKKLATQDLYSIGQTPLKFLVKERMDLARDSTVTGVNQKGDVLTVRVEDRSTLGGTSKITLSFDMAANELKQWVVVDPQGYETSVALYNLDTQRRPDPKQFVINYERML